MARYRPEDMDKIFAELEGESDRATISVAGSLLDYALERAIESRLRPWETPEDEEALFGDRGIYGTFSLKIDAAYFLKIIGASVRRDLALIRKIRNYISHNMNPVSFATTQEISGRCNSLYFPTSPEIGFREIPLTARQKFTLTSQFFTANLLLRAGDSNAEIAEAFKNLAPYLNR